MTFGYFYPITVKEFVPLSSLGVNKVIDIQRRKGTKPMLISWVTFGIHMGRMLELHRQEIGVFMTMEKKPMIVRDQRCEVQRQKILSRVKNGEQDHAPGI